MKNQVKSTLVLVCICAVMAVLLAVTNSITAPIIKENQDAAANEALLQVMPGGEALKRSKIFPPIPSPPPLPRSTVKRPAALLLL